jgi:hypothetical protein
MKGEAIVAVSAVVARGQDQNKMTARKIWDLSLLCSLLDVIYTCIGRRGNIQMKQKARVLTLISVLTTSAGG